MDATLGSAFEDAHRRHVERSDDVTHGEKKKKKDVRVVGTSSSSRDAKVDADDEEETVWEKSTRRHSSEWGVIGRGRRDEEEDERNGDGDDPFDLNRFVRCQSRDFERALREIQVRGEKCSCWMWYVIPTAPWIVNGEERGSFTNRRYALRDVDNPKSGVKAATAYLKRPIGKRGVHLRGNYLVRGTRKRRSESTDGVTTTTLLRSLL